MNQTPPSLTVCLKTYHSLCMYPICKDKKTSIFQTGSNFDTTSSTLQKGAL